MKTIITLFFLVLAGFAKAQDYHHWSEHFGARASLLGGAATAGLGDNATAYYNAAAMTYVDDPSLSISVNAYRIRMLKIENALGDGLDLEERGFSMMPNLIAGILELENHKRLRLGYTVITRRAINQKFDFLNEADDELLPQFDGPERWVNSYNTQHQMMEYWAGISLSYKLSNHFSLGISHFGIYRDVKYSNAYKISVLPKDFSGLKVYEYSNVQSFNYYNVKGVFRPSIAADFGSFKFGLSFTTPSFNMMGRGQAFREITYINFQEISNEIDVDVKLVDRVDGFKVMHKENGSLAMGVSWQIGTKSWMHITNETFFGGKRYYIFDVDEKPSIFPDAFSDDDLENEILGGQNFLSLTEKTHARTNIGIGFETILTDRWEMYLGARTDFLYNETPEVQRNVMRVESSRWSLMHFSLGLVHITKKNKRYTVGVEYGTAPINLVSSSENDIKTSFNSFKLLLEIIVGQKKKNQ
jgi:hypothetical protein